MNVIRKVMGLVSVMLIGVFALSSTVAFAEDDDENTKKYTLTMAVTPPATSPATVTATFTNKASSSFNSLTLALPTTGYAFASGATVSSSRGTAAFITGGIKVTSINLPAGSGQTVTVTMAGVTTSGACGAGVSGNWPAVVWTGSALSGSKFQQIAPSVTSTSIAPVCYTVTPSSNGNGTISLSTPQTVQPNARPVFTLTPATGYVVDTVGGTCGGTLTSPTFTTAAVTANCTVIANFKKNKFTVSASTTGTGGGTASPTAQLIPYLDTAVITLAPDGTSRVTTVTTNPAACAGTLSADTITYTTAPVGILGCAVTVNFARNQLSLSGPTTSVGAGTPFPVTIGLNGGPAPATVNVVSNCGPVSPASVLVIDPLNPLTTNVTIPAPSPPITRTCSLNVQESRYQSPTALSLNVFAGAISTCSGPGAVINPNFTNPNNVQPGAPGYAEGSRKLNKDTTCDQVNYTYVNGVLDNQGVKLTWDTSLQPNAVFSYTVFWKPEFVDPATGLPKRRTRVAWESDKYSISGPVWVFANACLTRDAPAMYTTLAGTGVNATAPSITVAGGSPPPIPFPITIDTERMTVTGVSGSTWTVTRNVGGTSAAPHSTGAKVMSTPLPIDPNATRPGGGANPYVGLVDHMCIYDELFSSVSAADLALLPPGSQDCKIGSPGYDANKPAACVQRSTSAFDIGDGFMDLE